MKKLLTTFVLSFVLFGANATDLPLGSVMLSLGMEQENVLKKLKEFYGVHEQPLISSSLFTVTVDKRPNSKLLGTISFYQGKLTWVGRQWGDFNMSHNPMEYSSALFAAIEGAAAASGSTATITTKISRVPSGEIKQIDFVFSDRKITTMMSDGRDQQLGKSVGITESISTHR
jgi:hypothetical protein